MTRRPSQRLELSPKPTAPSYWVGASREELIQRVAARRPQQRIPTIAEATYDPALSATTALAKDHGPRWQKGAR